MQKIKNILSIIIISIVSGPLTFGMEKDVQIIDPHVVGFDVFLNNQKECLSHQIIYSLAQVSKSCKKFLLDTAPGRSEYLLRKTKQIGINLQELRYLNTYGSLLCDMGKRFDYLFVSGYFLTDDKVEYSHATWNNFSSSVTSLPRPFLDSRGDLCCYGWGKYDGQLWGKKQHLIRYSLGPDGAQKFFRCGIEMYGSDKYEHYALSYFAALPNLLKAFANGPVDPRDDIFCYVAVALKDTIIPDNYAEYQDCGNAYLNMKFDQLPERLRNAIVKRYEKCKKEK